MFKALVKIIDLCGVEIVAILLFLSAVAFCVADGIYDAAAIAAVIVLGVVVMARWRYRRLTEAERLAALPSLSERANQIRADDFPEIFPKRKRAGVKAKLRKPAKKTKARK